MPMNTFKRALIIASTLAFAAIESIHASLSGGIKAGFRATYCQARARLQLVYTNRAIADRVERAMLVSSRRPPGADNVPALSGAVIGHNLRPSRSSASISCLRKPSG